MAIPETIDQSRIPRHVAIIMDGNGRWARSQGEDRIWGHNKGVESVRAVTEACAELKVEYLTLYAFSTENWNRPEHEVNALMNLLVHTISAEMKTLMDNNVRLHTIGDTRSLPELTQNELSGAIGVTAGNTGLNLVLALSYSARWEITEAVKKIATKASNGRLDVNDINEKTVSDHLSTAGIPDPELLIRTSGEQRISNFLLWQIAYTELYITPVLWPDFNKDEFFKAVTEFQRRERRFGLTSEQVKA
jgi:undecaprenyl diphosphate synthase